MLRYYRQKFGRIWFFNKGDYVMERYQVIFTFINFNGDEKEDFLDNNGQGFTIEEAENVSRYLQQGSVVTVTSTFVIPM